MADASEEALTLFAADKLSKLRELRREAAADRGSEPSGIRTLRARRLTHYRRSLALLEERLPESPLVHDFRNELGAVLHDSDMLAAIRLGAVGTGG